MDKNRGIVWESETSYIGKATYSNFWSPWVSGDSVKIRLKTDSSVTFWGFKIDKIEYETAPQGDEWDPADDSGSSGTWITPSTSLNQHGPHSLTSSDHYDWFRISMTAGRTYYFYGTWNTYSDTYAELYSDSSGSNLVTENDDGGGKLQFGFAYTPTVSRTYYLRIRSWGVGANSNYYLNYYHTAPSQNDAGSGGDAGDSFNDALTVSPGNYEGYIDSSDTEDWYKFSVTKGQRIEVSMTPPSGADFDLKLYDQNGNLKDSSVLSGSSTDIVTYIADSSGTFYWRFRVYQWNGDGTYSFNLNIIDPPPPSPVVSLSAPSSVEAGELYDVSITLSNAGDFATFGGARIEFDSRFGDIVNVYYGDFGEIESGITPSGSTYIVWNEWWEWEGGNPVSNILTGSVTLRAPTVSDLSGGNDFDLRYRAWHKRGEDDYYCDPACFNTYTRMINVQNDAGSGADAGDDFGAALLISPGSYQGYIDSSDTEDWYKFSVTKGQRIEVSMTPPSGADFDLKLYDANNVLKDSSTAGGSSTDTVTYDVVSSGTFYWRFKVYQYSGSGKYSFNLNIVNLNQPPTAFFTVTPGSGSTSTDFAFDASSSSDQEDPASVLQVRWDWENDGTWDTSFSTTKTASHQYTKAGTHTIKLEVRDSAGATSTAYKSVMVAAALPDLSISEEDITFEKAGGG